MMKRRLLSMLCAACGALALLGGCALMRKAVVTPTASFQKLNLRGLSFEGAAADVYFDVSNPNVFSISVEGYAYSLTIGGRTVLSGEHHNGMSLPARGTGQLVIPISIRFADVVDAVQALAHSDVWPYSIEGTLTIDTGPLAGIVVPFSHTDEIPRPVPPEVSVERLSVRSMSLSGVDFDVTLLIRNAGRLAYILEDMRGAIELNGQPFMDFTDVGDRVSLTPAGERRITLRTRVSPAGLARGLQEVISAGRAEYRFVGDAIVGNEKYGDLRLRLNEAGTVELTR